MEINDSLAALIDSTVRPNAEKVDRSGSFPRESVDALLGAGFGGLISSPDIGGDGATFQEAAATVRQLAGSCASTAMVYAMHLCGAAAIEAAGSQGAREAVAVGEHLTTLAFSERGSRSQFWVTTSTAAATDGGISLDAEKSWVTSAGVSDSYVWLSRPVEAAGPSTMWLVPAATEGLTIGPAFDGFGLRGNSSTSITATGATVPRSAMLGNDGAGLDLALSTVLPWFQLLNAACSVGICDAMVAAAVDHLLGTRLEHLDQSLAQQPTLRARLGRIKVLADSAATLLDDACGALQQGRADAPLRMLESKALAAEVALEVADEAMRLGGGSAFRKEGDLERHFRDARAASVMAPTTDALFDMIGRAVCGLPLLDEPA